MVWEESEVVAGEQEWSSGKWMHGDVTRKETEDKEGSEKAAEERGCMW